MKKSIFIALAVALAGARVFLFFVPYKPAAAVGAVVLFGIVLATLVTKARLIVKEKEQRKLEEKVQSSAQEINECKWMEEVLRESRERLDLALISARMAAFDWDIVNNNRTWSDGVHSLLGTKAETFSGTAEEFFQIMPPEDRSTVQADIDKAISTKSPYETEYRAIWPDGSVHHITARGKVSYDHSNRAVRMTGVCWDITERKRAEEQIALLDQELQRKLRELETANAGLKDSRQTAMSLADDTVKARQAAERASAELQSINESLRGSRLAALNMMEDSARSAQQADAARLEERSASEQRRLALEAADLGAWNYRLDTGEVFWDQRCRDTWGVAEGHQIDYSECLNRIHPEDRPGVDEAVKQAVAGAFDGAYHREFRVLWPDGSEHWISSHGRVYFEGEGRQRRAIRFVGVNREITEIKRAEEEAGKSETRYRALFDSMLEGFCVIEVIFDAQGKPVDYRFLEINPAFEAQTGLHNGKGKLMRDLAPEHEAHWFEFYGKVALTGQSARFVNEAKALGRWFDVSAYRVGGTESRRVAILFNDITESRAAAEALRESERKFRLLADSIPNLAWWANGDGFITWYNQRWYEYTGTTPQQMEGWGWQSVHHPQTLPAVLERWKGCIAAGQPFEMTFPLLGADGLFRSFLTRAMPLKDAQGRVQQWFGTNTDVSDKQRNEEAHARLAAIVESSDDAILSKDISGTITSWNAGAERLFGYRPEEAVGRSIKLLLPPQRQDEEDLIMVRLQAGERVEHFETVRVAKDGRSLPVSVTISPLKDGAGRIIGASKIVRDITERKQKEEELQKLNRTLKALRESSQAMTRANSENTYLEEVCKDVIAHCGHAMVWIGFAEADQGRTVRPVAYAGFAKGYLETLQITWADNERGRGPTGTAIRTGQPGLCRDVLGDPALKPWREEAIKRGYASSMAVPLLSEGKAFGAITIYSRQADAFSQDEIRLLSQLADDVSNCIRSLRAIAQRQQAEAQLRLLSTALESADNGVAVTDRQGQILWVNPAFTKLTGYSRDEAVGKNPRVLKSGQHPAEFYQQMWATIVKGEPWHGELVNRHKDGSLYPEEMTITPVRADGANITHFVAIKQDIRERKSTQAALLQTTDEVKRSNRDLEQFAYIASHDLQEPLRAVGGYVKLLQRRFPENIDPKAVEYINGAAEGAARMERLINDLLAFSRVGTHGEAFSPADLNEVLNEALYNLQISIKTAQAKVTRDVLPTLAVDATQMMQIFQNLIGNAIKFRGERPPEIHVGVQKQPGKWVFSVRDNGIGIEPEYFERIFQIFQRLHTRGHYPGTGIGLAICKKMVERHNGSIWVESQPGQGTTFFFSLPQTSANMKQSYDNPATTPR